MYLLLVLLSKLVILIASSPIPCGWQTGYDLSLLASQSLTLPYNIPDEYNLYIKLCGVNPYCSNPSGLLGTNTLMSCAGLRSRPDLIALGDYNSSITQWSNTPSGPRLDVGPGLPGPWGVRLDFVCGSEVVPSINYYSNYQVPIVDVTLMSFLVSTSLACGSANQTLIDAASNWEMYGSSSTAGSSPTDVVLSSTGSSNPGCNITSTAPLKAWYFSYTAIISATYSITFTGTFYTASGIPSGIRFLQVVEIDAFWILTIAGISTRVLVTQLDINSINIINVNGGELFPLEGQSLSFYVGSEKVVLSSTFGSVFPTVVNSTFTVRAATFVYSGDQISHGC